MRRLSVPTWLATAAAVTLVSAVAGAESVGPGDPETPSATGVRLAVPTPPELYTGRRAQISGTIYLERCRGGCTVTQGANDARAMSSSIPDRPGAYTISEYRNGSGQTGTQADAEWGSLVQCMREVYSPYNITVTDARPAGTSYHLAIVAGLPQDIGLSSDILGVAPLATDCSPQDNVISFSFANAHPQTDMVGRVNNLCWTAAQESAHAFGLDHQYEYVTDKRSACNDPMTYRADCGGQKFFRNQSASCGEFQTRPCRCGGTQNSHQKLLSVFDGGQSLIPAPSVAITTPRATDTVLGMFVAASAGSRRGVSRVELWVNGFKWAEARGAAFGPGGQPNPAPYGIQVPASLPSSVVDIQVRAYDDIGLYTESAPMTLTHGAPCESADACAKGQKCEEGRCFWDPPAGEIGDECAYSQFCISGVCRGTAEKQICTQDCAPGVENSCPSGFACAPTEPGHGICFFPDDSGCCSTGGGGGGAPWAPIGLATLTLGLLARARRRR